MSAPNRIRSTVSRNLVRQLEAKAQNLKIPALRTTRATPTPFLHSPSLSPSLSLSLSQISTSPSKSSKSEITKEENSVVMQSVKNSYKETVEFVTPKQKAIVRDLRDVFVEAPVDEDLHVVTIAQRTRNDMSVWSAEVEDERKDLSGLFVSKAQRVCLSLRERGYFADYVDPYSGESAMSGEKSRNGATLCETDDCFNLWGYKVFDYGCCKVLAHPSWGTHCLVGTLATSAPEGVVRDLMSEL